MFFVVLQAISVVCAVSQSVVGLKFLEVFDLALQHKEKSCSSTSSLQRKGFLKGNVNKVISSNMTQKRFLCTPRKLHEITLGGFKSEENISNKSEMIHTKKKKNHTQ